MSLKTVFEDGYSWVEIPDEMWYNKEVTEYWQGIPVYAPMFTFK